VYHAASISQFEEGQVLRTRWTVIAILLLLVPPGASVASPPPSGGFVALVPLAESLAEPLGIAHAGDGSGRLFIAEHRGKIKVFDGFQVLATPFLDTSPLIGCPSNCGDRGLLGLAFHPRYKTNGALFVAYTRGDGDIVIARFQVSADPNVANPDPAAILLTIEHSEYQSHDGGQLAFGPDGYLYISTGDGGGNGDPLESGQSLDTLLGKILRIDVDGGPPYAIPPGNPFAGAQAGRDEIWDYGLRNPWRFSFDRQTGDLYIADVGQNLWEEIDFELAGGPGGVNYGWDCREGAHDYDDPNGDGNAGCPVASVDPVLEYGHDTGCSVTGGYVYRGGVRGFLAGRYLYGDFCTGEIWHAAQGTGGVWTPEKLSVPASWGLTSFGEGENGRIYATYLGGTLHWLSPYTFEDVPPTHWAWPYVEAMLASGLTLGCDTTPRYCPDSAATRADVAVFLVRATHGAGFVPPPPSGVFADVPTGHRAAAYIEQLYHDGITNGCATSPLRYCPDAALTRADVAPFLVRVRHGAGYIPPAVGSPSFADVPAGFWAAPWIEQLYQDGGTNGCAASPLRYCLSNSVTRAEAAGFIAKTFNLPLP